MKYFNESSEPLRLSYLQALPWCAESMTSAEFGGILKQAIDLLSDKMGFKYTTEPIIEYGSGLPNGSWTGSFGKLQRNELDIVIGPWVVDNREFEGLRTTTTFYTGSSLGMVASTTKPNPSSFFGFILTFSFDVWAYILASMAVLIAASTFIDYTLKNRDHKDSLFGYYFWTYLAAFMYEGSPHSPPTFPSRFLFGIWLMAMVVLMNAFTGQFKALLMVSSNPDIIKDVHDLAARKDNLAQMPDYIIFHDCFKYSDNPVYREVWDIAVKNKALIRVDDLLNPANFQRVKDGRATFMSDPTLIKVGLSYLCGSLKGKRQMYYVDGFCHSFHFAFGVSDSIPEALYKELNKRILWIVEANLINHWAENYSKDLQKCLHVDEGLDGTPLGMEHIFGAFVLLFSIQGLAFLVLIAEHIHLHFNKN